MKLTNEQKRAIIAQLRPIDDLFFEVLAENKAVCQEIIATIMEDPGLVVEEAITQRSERNIYGHSVRLDALCTLGNGTKVNVEVQRGKENHLRRVRFNASAVTYKESHTGKDWDYNKVIELVMIYISETDVFEKGKTIYHVDKILRETGMIIDDGLQEIFVNTAVDDGTTISDLMKGFMQTDFDDPRFPELTSEIKKQKDTKGETGSMCEALQEVLRASYNEGAAEAEKEKKKRIAAEKRNAEKEKVYAKERAAYAEERAAYQSRIAELEARLAMQG